MPMLSLVFVLTDMKLVNLNSFVSREKPCMTNLDLEDRRFHKIMEHQHDVEPLSAIFGYVPVT